MGHYSEDIRKFKDELRSMIARSELVEGTVLNEDDLRRESGQSVRVVRNALCELASEGWLLRRPRVGTVVLGPTKNRAAPKLRSVGILSCLIRSALNSENFLTTVLRGVRKELRPPKQLHFFMHEADERVSGLDDPPRVEAAKLRSQVQGVISIEANSATTLNEMARGGLPVVAVDFAPRNATFDAVCVDHIHAGYLATEHLLRLGHRRIAFAGEQPLSYSTDPTWQERLTGYLRAMAEAGDLNVSPKIFTIRLRSAHPHIAEDLPGFHAQVKPTAYVLADSSSAPYMIQTLKQLGLQVPADISLACATGVLSVPPQGIDLSRVRVDYDGLGENAVRLIEARLAYKTHPPVVAYMPVFFESGGSSQVLV